MQVLNQNDYKLFKTIVGLRQNSLMKTLDAFFRRKYDKGKIIKTDAYIYAEGDIPIALSNIYAPALGLAMRKF